MLEIQNPLFASCEAFAPFFVRQRQIEMHVCMGGHGARGATKMVDGLIEFAQFFESAAQVVAGNAIERIDLHGAEKCVARIGELAELVVRNAEVDVSLDPVGGKFDDTLIVLDRLGKRVLPGFAIERTAKKIFGRRSGHGMELGWLCRHIEREGPLLQKRVERNFRARRNDVNFPAQVNESKLMQGGGSCAELFFDESHRAFYFARGNVVLRQALKRAKSDQIDEAVKALAPARFRADQLQTFPIAETVRLKTKNAAGFRPRVSLRQFLKTPAPKKILKGLCT